MITQHASLWEQTTWAPRRGNRSACPFVVLMGKNTMMCMAIQGHLENNPALEKLLPHIQGNVGFMLPKKDLIEMRDMLLANEVPAVAHAGATVPCEVITLAQKTGLGPEKTSFFQVLGITTKILRGTIEILSDVPLIKTRDKMGASKAALLNILNISSFSSRLISYQVFNSGSIGNPEVLAIQRKSHSCFLAGVCNVTSVCRLVTLLLHRCSILSSVGTSRS